MRRRAFLTAAVAGTTGCTGLFGDDDDGPRTEIRNESPERHEVSISVGQRDYRGESLTTTVDSGEISWHDDPFWVGDVSGRDLQVEVTVDGQTAFAETMLVALWVDRYTVTVTGPTEATVEKFPPRTAFGRGDE